MDATQDQNYMKWWKAHGEQDNVNIEYPAWLAGQAQANDLIGRLKVGLQRILNESDWCAVCQNHGGSHSLDCPMRTT
jgi:hypothetical protein